MLDLCKILDITVNELLSGERIPMEEYQQKAEQNLVDLQQKKMQAQMSLLKVELIWLGICILLIPVHFAINYYFPNNNGTGIGTLIMIIGIIMFVIYFFRHYEIRLK